MDKNFQYIRINDVNEYIHNEDALYLTSSKDVADYLSEKNVPVCIELNDEEDLSVFDGYRYFTIGNEMDIEHLKKVYCHQKDIPYVIGESDELIIREEKEDDLEYIYEMYQDEECIKYLEPLPDITSVNPHERFLSVKDSYMLFGYGMWIVEEKETGERIGRVGFEYYDDNTVSIGFMIKKEKRGKGYGKIAARLCIQYLYKTLTGMKVVAKCHQNNVASIHILESLGIEIVENTEREAAQRTCAAPGLN
jgi:RimJ/RimL family protein N-acetyltransferase